MLDHTNEDDGTFFMPLDDMLRLYSNMSICCNPSPKVYKRQQKMVDFNSSEFPSVAFLRVQLNADIELTDKTFGVYYNQ
jgi:hypothetical protein